MAHAAVSNKIPFIIVRCMSDMAEDNVDSVYQFNEDEAAQISESFVEAIIDNL